MKLAPFSFLLFAASATVVAAPPKQASLPMDKRDPLSTAGNDEATKEWLRSWHKGEAYFTQTDYLFEGELEVENNKEANWLQRWSVKMVQLKEKGSFFGKALAKTFVYHEMPHLRLSRDYQYVMGEGTWGASATPKSQLIQEAIGEAVKEDVFGKKNRRMFYEAVKMHDPELGETLATWGEAGWEISKEWLSANIGAFDEEGRVNIGTNSVIAKAMDIDERQNAMAAAVAFSDHVNGRKIAVAQDGRYTRRIREIKSLLSTDKNPADSVEAFNSYLNQGSKANEELEALIKRESFSISADLFDSEVRKPGDIWTIDASFFNSFLHPDLKGAFRGTAVVKYIRDEEGDDAYFSVPMGAQEKPKAYDVRKLEVLPRAMIDGSAVSTDFSYDERPMGGRFWASYDAKRSNIVILVDIKSGHVVYGKVNLRADKVGALPSLKLLRGFQSAGEGSLILTLQGDVFSAAELAGGTAE